MTSPPATMLRVSDAEREAAVTRLHHALGEGRLDLAETEVRVAAAYAATHRSDLEPLFADLPPDPRAGSGGPTWDAVWTSAVSAVRGRRRVATVLLAVFLGLSAVGGAAGMALGAAASAGAHLDGDHHGRPDPRGDR